MACTAQTRRALTAFATRTPGFRLSVLGFCFVAAASTSADVPKLLQYQGKLTTTAGAFVTGPVSLRARLYPHPTNTTPLLFDETHPVVALNNGLFSILIGSVAPGGLPDSAFSTTDIYLAISINAAPDLAPRTRIATAPYATKASAAEKLVTPGTLDPRVAIAPAGNVGIGTTTPHASALLDLSSTSGGLSLPRMTAAQRDAIPSPVIGLLIFNTTSNCINMWTGATWKQSCFDCAFTPPVASNNGPLCEGGTLALSATTVLGATYAWTGPNAFSSNQQNPTIPSATPAASGPYSVSATVSGCTATPVTTVATVNPSPTAPTISNNGPLCAGQTLVLTSSPVAGATYSWTGPNSFSSNVQSPSIPNVTTAASGAYTLVVSTNGCAAPPVSTTATVNAIPPTPGSISGPTSPCAGSSGNIYSIVDVGAPTYTWTVPSGASIANGQGTAFITVTFASTSGNISVTASNTCGSSSPRTLAINLSGAGSPMTFTYTGSVQTFTVPTCISALTIEAYGAQGGLSNGGLGGMARATFAVTAGQVLNIYVGGQGGERTAGFNGGGTGGTGMYQGGGGGGGASDVRIGGTSAADRKIVAGGGGGGGGRPCIGGGGAGGGGQFGGAGGGSGYACSSPTSPTSGNSTNGGDGMGYVGGCGCPDFGGTAGAGGAGGTTTGGNGTNASPPTGGGSGGTGGTNSSGGTPGIPGDHSNGQSGLTGGGGGGGASFITGSGTSSPAHAQGVRSGNGQVILSW